MRVQQVVARARSTFRIELDEASECERVRKTETVRNGGGEGGSSDEKNKHNRERQEEEC